MFSRFDRDHRVTKCRISMGFPTDFRLKFAAGKDEESFGKSRKIMHWTSHESSKQVFLDPSENLDEVNENSRLSLCGNILKPPK